MVTAWPTMRYKCGAHCQCRMAPNTPFALMFGLFDVDAYPQPRLLAVYVACCASLVASYYAYAIVGRLGSAGRLRGWSHCSHRRRR